MNETGIKATVSSENGMSEISICVPFVVGREYYVVDKSERGTYSVIRGTIGAIRIETVVTIEDGDLDKDQDRTHIILELNNGIGDAYTRDVFASAASAFAEIDSRTNPRRV